MNFSLRAKKQELEMEKKIYESPVTDVIKIRTDNLVLGWDTGSIGEGSGDVDAKQGYSDDKLDGELVEYQYNLWQ